MGRLEELLLERQSSLVKKWRTLIIQTYPENASKFLSGQKDPFANPVGHSITEAAGRLFLYLVRGDDEDEVEQILDDILRIRAVQNFKPSDAVGWVLSLKTCVQDEIKGRLDDAGLARELRGFEERVDRLGLQAFDVYTACRQQVYEMRLNQVRGGPLTVDELKQRKLERAAGESEPAAD